MTRGRGSRGYGMRTVVPSPPVDIVYVPAEVTVSL